MLVRLLQLLLEGVLQLPLACSLTVSLFKLLFQGSCLLLGLKEGLVCCCLVLTQFSVFFLHFEKGGFEFALVLL